ncbi:MAG: hypothetical protein HRU75_11050 [Planctomycetia bacterium]|nr:MAG: hypothetical protein HRU75_11050 [Planctomycetia bacterium]
MASNLPGRRRRARRRQRTRPAAVDAAGVAGARTLLLTDAGLVGYRVLTRLQNCGHAFIVRVGRNVTLLRKLGYHLRDARAWCICGPTRSAARRR